MASFIYNVTAQRMLTGGLSWSQGGFLCSLVDNTYLPDPTETNFTHPAVVTKPMSTFIESNGAADADDLVFENLNHTSEIVAAVIWNINTGEPIAYIDNVIGFPIMPNGTDIRVVWSNEPARIFKP
ncbi:MAG: hypothetical protein WCS28_11780 [Thiomicrospira sp.]|jgi:hypothetical protein